MIEVLCHKWSHPSATLLPAASSRVQEERGVLMKQLQMLGMRAPCMWPWHKRTCIALAELASMRRSCAANMPHTAADLLPAAGPCV